MKTERLIANVTPVGSPDRAEHDILGVILGVFWPSQAVLLAEEPLCDVGTPPLSPIHLIAYQSIFLSIYPTICLHVDLSIHLSIHLSTYGNCLGHKEAIC